MKIGICFPGKDFLSEGFENIKEYIMLLKTHGLYSFDMYTSLLTNDYDVGDLLDYLHEQDIKLTFHYNGNMLEHNFNNIYDIYKQDLIKLRNKLQAHNIFYRTTIVFHALDYEKEYQKYEHELNQIELFKKICEIAEQLNFDILVETLSINRPKGNHMGDDYIEIENLISKVNKSNFGVCWDMGHTRLNNIDNNSDILPSKTIIEAVKFTHIHNFSMNDKTGNIIDHLPLTNNKYLNTEIKYLLDNNYDGVFSLEIDTNNLKENINIYLNSINILKNIIRGEIK